MAGQYAAVDPNLTGRENLVMVGRLTGMSRADVRTRAAQLLEQFQLTEIADRPSRTYSGGQRRRFDLAAALVHRPRILFFDEPTTGLDPRSRRDLWTVLEQLVADGTTVLLTTQYLEEADHLADHLVVLDRGSVIAQGTPAQLKADLGAATASAPGRRSSPSARRPERLPVSQTPLPGLPRAPAAAFIRRCRRAQRGSSSLTSARSTGVSGTSQHSRSGCPGTGSSSRRNRSGCSGSTPV